MVKRPKDEVELMLAEVRKKNAKGQKKNKKKKGNANDDSVARLTKSQKRSLKLKAKKAKKKQLLFEDEHEISRDVVGFGETVHAPPTLGVLPRRVQKEGVAPRVS